MVVSASRMTNIAGAALGGGPVGATGGEAAASAAATSRFTMRQPSSAGPRSLDAMACDIGAYAGASFKLAAHSRASDPPARYPPKMVTHRLTIVYSGNHECDLFTIGTGAYCSRRTL